MSGMANISIATTVLLVGYMIAIIAYRLLLHPLSKVPGPRLAAISRAHELYYDVLKRGRLPWKIKELHEQYGPIVRIAPDEVHIADRDYAYQHFNSRNDKYAPHKYRFGFPEATSETINADLHKLRYAAFAPAFSQRAVTQLEPLLLAKVDKVCQRLSGFGATGEPVNLRQLFLCMTTDIITAYSFHYSFDTLDDPELGFEWYKAQEAGLRAIQTLKHFPFLWKALRSEVVGGVIARVMPGLAMTKKLEDRNKMLARDAIAFYAKQKDESRGVEGVSKGHLSSQTGSSPSDGDGYSTIFSRLLNSNLPEQEKTYDRLWQEASSIMGAGTETVASLLCFILVHLLDDPKCLAKVKAELRSAMPEATAPLPSWHQLSDLPYLSAVISEGLRMAWSVPSRFMRVLREHREVHGYALPPGTVTSMSVITLHTDEAVWPESDVWRPERFIGDGSRGREELFAFSRGHRICLGMNLAYAELYLTLAAVIRRFDLRLFETTLRDVEPCFDGLVALAAPGSKGVRVLCQQAQD